jgi:hypothetical protein
MINRAIIAMTNRAVTAIGHRLIIARRKSIGSAIRWLDSTIIAASER